MGTLANISSAEAIRAFEKLGWVRVRQTGSHIILAKPGERILSVPRRKECAQGTLRTLIRDANLSVDDFLALL